MTVSHTATPTAKRVDYRDLSIEALADSEARLIERVADLEDTLAGYQNVSRVLLQRLYALEGDDLPGYWDRLDEDVAAGLHAPPRSVVAKLKRANRLFKEENRRLRASLSSLSSERRAAA
jgi:hypothetical protein